MPFDAAWHFQRAQGSYDQAATIQRSMAEHLVSALRPLAPPRGWSKVFELGCGALTLTQRLCAVFSEQDLWLNDLWSPPPERLQKLPCRQIHFLEGDAEHIDWPRNCSLIAANAVLQWFQQPLSVFSKAYEALEPDGFLALGLFLPGTFAEFQKASGRGLDYPSEQAWTQAAESQRWREVFRQTATTTLNFPSARALMQHLRDTGVNGTAREVWTRSRWEHFLANYPRSSDGSWPLTYHSWLWILRRPS